MLFNSMEVLFFFSIVYSLFWLLKNDLKWQNLLITISSLIFYGWWDYRFVGLMMIAILSNFTIALAINNQDHKYYRSLLLWSGLIINFGILIYFKYFNFFIDSFASISAEIGFQVNFSSLDLILPIGISLYTFQTVSYTIDVYNRRLEPTKDIIAFTGFVIFFPQLVAEPIERANYFLSQTFYKTELSYASAVAGARLIPIGLFKKVVIADNSAPYANFAFNNYETMSGLGMFMGAFFLHFKFTVTSVTTPLLLWDVPVFLFFPYE
jgi:D-alanyl-lipoteichoic acid acyltransferase DltB (MBOAT superfamily)